MSRFSRSWPLVGAGVVVLGTLLVGLVVARNWMDARSIAAFEEASASRAPLRAAAMGELPDEVIETSGLAVGRARPGTFWTHNDSGDGARLYALDSTAALRATYTVAGAMAIDWEALDVGPCPGAAAAALADSAAAASVASCLYVGDIGDNGADRPEVTIYVVREPVGDGGDVELVGRLGYRYPDGAHDSESLAVAPDGGVVIVTKGRAPRERLHHLSPTVVERAVASGEVVDLEDGVDLPIPIDWNLGRVATGAAISPDGAVLAVKTYSEIYFFRWPITGSPEVAAPPCFLGQTQPQGESVAFWSAGRIVLTSEDRGGREGRLLSVTCAGLAFDDVS